MATTIDSFCVLLDVGMVGNQSVDTLVFQSLSESFRVFQSLSESFRVAADKKTAEAGRI